MRTIYLHSAPANGRYAVDRRVFAYRRVISDNTLACTLLIATFFASVSFIVLFLGLESFFEGITVWQGVSQWVSQAHGLYLRACPS